MAHEPALSCDSSIDLTLLAPERRLRRQGTGGDLHCPQFQGSGAGVPTEQLHWDSGHPEALLTTYRHGLGEVATAAEENEPALRRGAGTEKWTSPQEKGGGERWRQAEDITSYSTRGVRGPVLPDRLGKS